MIDEVLEAADENQYFAVNLYQMDIERVRYSLARYLRARLLKLDAQVEHVVGNHDLRDRLSPQVLSRIVNQLLHTILISFNIAYRRSWKY